MKQKPCVVYGNTRWGFCFSPIRCGSIARARKVAKQFWFARIVVKDDKGVRTINVYGRNDE